MARLNAIDADGLRAKGRPHDVIGNAKSFYFVESGETIFQIDTYGRAEIREVPGKLSQTVQLSRMAARQLIAQLQEAFPEILSDPVRPAL